MDKDTDTLKNKTAVNMVRQKLKDAIDLIGDKDIIRVAVNIQKVMEELKNE